MNLNSDNISNIAASKIHLINCRFINSILSFHFYASSYPPVKMASSQYHVCYNFHRTCTTKSLKIGGNVVRVSNSFDLGETPSYSAFHPDPSCLHMAL